MPSIGLLVALKNVFLPPPEFSLNFRRFLLFFVNVMIAMLLI